MALNLSPLKKAITSLSRGLNRALQNRDDLEVRDGCIQRFEYTYELAQKTIRRYLAITEAASIQELSFPSLIRLAYERGLLHEEWSIWKAFRDARNTTSHTYDENKAHEVFEHIPTFLVEAKFLYNEIEKRQALEK